MSYKKIKTWEAACKVHGTDPTALPINPKIDQDLQDWIIETYKMGVIVKAINTDESGILWTPNFNNPNERKYYAFFGVKATKKKPGGVGFSSSGYGNWYTATTVGSRLTFPDLERLQHVQKYFKKNFKGMLLITK